MSVLFKGGVMKLTNKEHYIDPMTHMTYREDTEEVCCPNCGSWTSIHDLLSDPEELITYCPLCSPFHDIEKHVAYLQKLTNNER